MKIHNEFREFRCLAQAFIGIFEEKNKSWLAELKIDNSCYWEEKMINIHEKINKKEFESINSMEDRLAFIKKYIKPLVITFSKITKKSFPPLDNRFSLATEKLWPIDPFPSVCLIGSRFPIQIRFTMGLTLQGETWLMVDCHYSHHYIIGRNK